MQDSLRWKEAEGKQTVLSQITKSLHSMADFFLFFLSLSSTELEAKSEPSCYKT